MLRYSFATPNECRQNLFSFHSSFDNTSETAEYSVSLCHLSYLTVLTNTIYYKVCQDLIKAIYY